jgi:hypothetical protein
MQVLGDIIVVFLFFRLLLALFLLVLTSLKQFLLKYDLLVVISLRVLELVFFLIQFVLCVLRGLLHILVWVAA